MQEKDSLERVKIVRKAAHNLEKFHDVHVATIVCTDEVTEQKGCFRVRQADAGDCRREADEIIKQFLQFGLKNTISWVSGRDDVAFHMISGAL